MHVCACVWVRGERTARVYASMRMEEESGPEVCASVQRDLCIGQKRPANVIAYLSFVCACGGRGEKTWDGCQSPSREKRGESGTEVTKSVERGGEKPCVHVGTPVCTRESTEEKNSVHVHG